jgi:hypothetical protein
VEIRNPAILGVEHALEETRPPWPVTGAGGQVLRQFGFQRSFERGLNGAFDLVLKLGFEGFILSLDFTVLSMWRKTHDTNRGEG